MTGARLARLRRRARIVLTLEAVAVAALPPLGVIALFLIGTLLGFGGWLLDAAGILALGAALYHARRRYAPPAPAAVDRRIERDSRLPHRPIAAFEDHPALAGRESAPLWRAHRVRLDAAIAGARVGRPAPDLATHDPFALRILLLLALLAAWIAAGPDAGNRLARALTPPPLFSAAGIGLQAWITPPRWTGDAPRLVRPGPRPIHALAGSTMSLIVTGAGAAPRSWAGERRLGFQNIETGSYRATARLAASETVTVGPFWRRIARFHLVVAPPAPPTIGFTSPPMPDRDGKRIDLAWRAISPYGLSRATLEMAPLNATRAKPDMVPLPPGAPRDRGIEGRATLDLLSSPYAGMTVRGRLAATNPAGLSGRSGMAFFPLPAPMLHNATAKGIEAVRRAYALEPASRPSLAAELAGLAAHPPGPLTPGTRRDLARFAAAFAKAAPPHAETTLWTLVQRAEQGAAFRLEQQAEAARQALEHALDKALAGHSPSQQQLRQLLDQLQTAERARLGAEQPAPARQARSMAAEMSAIDRLARKIGQEAQAGHMRQARQALAKLRDMLDRLRRAKPASAAQQARQQAAERSSRALSRMMRNEAKLLDRTARQNPVTPPQPGQAGQKSGASLADRQQALRQRLQALAQAMNQAGLPNTPPLGQGSQAMASAESHLRQGDQPGAMQAERAAIQALQQAQGALAMQLGHGTGSGPSGLGQNASGGQGEYGNENQGTISLGRAGTHSTAREIQNDLIRRDAQPNLPPPAHDYYRRLLGHEF